MSVTELHYNTVSEARAHFSALIDAAEAGVPATVRRDRRRAAVVDADRLRHFLVNVRPARAEVIAEGGGWSILLPGLPIAADGETFEEALDEMVAALREYAEDWPTICATPPTTSRTGAWSRLLTCRRTRNCGSRLQR